MLMNFFAGWEENAEVVDETLLDVIQFRMISYYKIKPKKNHKKKATKKQNVAEIFFRNRRLLRYKCLMMDSGAFSAWNSTAAINIEEYFKFCVKHYEDVDYFVALDHIPEIPGDTVSAEFSATRSWNRYKDMVHHFEENSLDPIKIIPVYHHFEHPRHLERMLVAGIPYIGLSPSNENGVTDDDKRTFLDLCFKLVAPNGKPLCKTHAFGLSSYKLLGWKNNTAEVEFPFYSADSTTWAEQAKFMNIIVPKWASTFTLGTDQILEKIFQTKWDFSEIYSVDISALMERPEYLFAKKANGEFKVSEAKRENVIEYVRDLGHIIGTSNFRERTRGEGLLPDELELDGRTNEAKQKSVNKKVLEDKFWTEEAIELGLIHSRQWRMWVNCITVNYWTDTLYPGTYSWFHREPPDPEFTEEQQKKHELEKAVSHQKIKDRRDKR